MQVRRNSPETSEPVFKAIMKKELRVLLVDDDEDEYVLLKGMFARVPGNGDKTRYVLEWASSYEEGLQACSQNGYDLFLIDYHLGKYNGLDLMRALEEQGCSAPAILLTGQGSYELDLAAMQLGAADYLLKDQVNEYLLERSIRYTLERKGIQDELELRVQERTHELARANDSLRESEARFRTLTETTSAAIFIIQDRKIRYANPAARFITGYAPEELLEMELWELAHPAYQATLKGDRLVSQWAADVPARYEIKIIKRDGEERWLDVTAGTMNYEQRPAYLLTAFDITDRDLAERGLQKAKEELEQRVIERTSQIRAANQRLQTVLRTLPVGIMIADEEGRIVESNDVMETILGGKLPQPAKLENFAQYLGWWTETGQRLAENDWPLVRAVREGETIIGKVIDQIAFDGKHKSILTSAVPILNAEGEIVGGVSVAQDITHQRKLEQQAQAAAREAQQRAEELEGLHRATTALLSTLDIDQLLCQILDAAQSAIPAAENGLLYLVKTGTGQLQPRASLGFNNDRIRTFGKIHGKDYPARVVYERKPMLVVDTLRDDFDQSQEISEIIPAGIHAAPSSDDPEMIEVRSLIIAPLKWGDRVLGALSLSSSHPGAFDTSNLRLLDSFAATTTAAIQNALLHAEVKELAVRDPLTGQLNRRAFFDLGQREMERFQRFNTPLAAIMIDMDNFKRVNDTYGHGAGDQVLKILAQRCADNIRDTDLFGRYGGDEFSILLPNTELETATLIAHRILRVITTEPLMTDQGPVSITLSLGVAMAEPQHQELAHLLEEADRALYQAKNKGKNRVEVI